MSQNPRDWTKKNQILSKFSSRSLSDFIISRMTADDCSLVAVVRSPQARSEVSLSLNRDLEQISSWCVSKGMKLNAGKTKAMIVCRCKTLMPPHPPLEVDAVRIDESSSLEILSVLLDTKLTFEERLRRVAARASAKIDLLRRVNSVFDDAAVAVRCF